jgi:hypothetical protein
VIRLELTGTQTSVSTQWADPAIRGALLDDTKTSQITSSPGPVQDCCKGAKVLDEARCHGLAPYVTDRSSAGLVEESSTRRRRDEMVTRKGS